VTYWWGCWEQRRIDGYGNGAAAAGSKNLLRGRSHIAKYRAIRPNAEATTCLPLYM